MAKEDQTEIINIDMRRMAHIMIKMIRDMNVVAGEMIENGIAMVDIVMTGILSRRSMSAKIETKEVIQLIFVVCKNIQLNTKSFICWLFFNSERYRGRDDRYADYDQMNKSRRDRKKDRSINGSERGDYPPGYYHQPMNQPFGYDPYSSYYQHQQYYENLRRTNPIAYAEWYNRYFASQLTAAASAVANVARDREGRESGRESVHSGRSSTKDNDRLAIFLKTLDISNLCLIKISTIETEYSKKLDTFSFNCFFFWNFLLREFDITFAYFWFVCV